MTDDPTLNRARAARDHYQKLAAAEEKNIERLQGEKPKDPAAKAGQRTTSAAKTVDPSALDRARGAKQHYEKAAAGAQKDVERAQTQKTQAQRKAAAKPREAQTSDQRALEQKQAEERAKAAREALKSKTGQQGPNHGMSRDRER